MFRAASFNVNGIRAAQRRGFEDWLSESDCDVLALQEVRCRIPDMPSGVFSDYHVAYDPGQLAGRNGVAVLTRSEPAAIRSWSESVHHYDPRQAQWQEREPDTAQEPLSRELKAFANQGRYIEVDLADSPITVASLYLPKGGLPLRFQTKGREEADGEEKYLRKMSFLSGFARHLTKARRTAKSQGRELLVMGDFNIAHTQLDVKNWKQNQKSEGFLPEEREWFDQVVSPRTMVDVIRRIHRDTPGPYSWWSWRGQAFLNDVGWRIDYHLATPGLARNVIEAGTERADTYEERISDHAPVIAQYALPKPSGQA